MERRNLIVVSAHSSLVEVSELDDIYAAVDLNLQTTNQMASLDHNLYLLPLLFIIIIISSFHVLPVSLTPSHKLKSAITIRKLNLRGPYIGLVTVIETEENAFLRSVEFRPDPTHPFLDLSGIHLNRFFNFSRFLT